MKDSTHLDQLSTHVKATTFHDAKNTTRDTCLVGPPSLEFAPYNKIPSGRVRHDGRQGTIDQDREFIDFLQSLTEPVTKPAGGADADAKPEKVTITPLVQFIKEKKANKAKEKEAAAAKASKKQDSKDTKSASPEQAIVVKKTTANTEAEKARVAKATQDAVKAINRSVAAMQGKSTPAKEEEEAKTPAKGPTPPTQQTPKRERQRGDASAAARIIGRDLGLTPKEGRTPRNARAVTNPAPATTSAQPASPQTPVPTPPPAALAQPQITPVQPPTGPRNFRNNTPQPSPLRPSPIPVTPKTNTKPPPQPSAGAQSAFLKHANPSQGVTEELLGSTFSVYGTLTRCEIDKKKGLGYIDFTDTESLRKAMAASPVKIGNGSVVVLENRTPYRKVSQTNSKANGGRPTTSTASSPQVAHASLATIVEHGQNQPQTAPAPSTSTQPSKAQPESASILPESTPEAPVQPNTTPTTANETPTPSQDASLSPATPPPAPRGGQNNSRGYRGRGNYRGRGRSQRGGGTRAASTPVSASADTGAATAGGG